MRIVAASYQIDGAVELVFEPAFRQFRVRMVVEGLVDTGDGTYILEYRTQVVADQDDGAFAVDFFQLLIELRFEPLVYISIGFIQYDHIRLRYDGPAEQGTLQLAAAETAYRTVGQCVQPIRQSMSRVAWCCALE